MTSWGELFSPRQQVALETFAELVSEVPEWVTADGGDDYQVRAVATALGLCVGKLAQHLSCLVRWLTREGQSKATSAFGRPDLSMSWDFAEVNPFGGSVGTGCRLWRRQRGLTGLLSRTARPLLLSKVMLAEGVRDLTGSVWL